MAIAYRSTGVFDSAASATCVIVKPSGLAVGDLMIAVIRRAAVVNPTSLPSANWTLVSSQLTTYGTWVYKCLATATEVAAANFTFTWAASAKCLGRAHAFSGVNTTTPVQQNSAYYVDAVSGTAINIPTITTSQANTTVLLLASGYATTAKTFTVPTSPAYSEKNDTGSTSPDFWQAIASYSYPTSGTATGVLAYPISVASTNRAGIAIAVNQAAAPAYSGTAATSCATGATSVGSAGRKGTAATSCASSTSSVGNKVDAAYSGTAATSAATGASSVGKAGRKGTGTTVSATVGVSSVGVASRRGTATRSTATSAASTGAAARKGSASVSAATSLTVSPGLASRFGTATIAADAQASVVGIAGRAGTTATFFATTHTSASGQAGTPGRDEGGSPKSITRKLLIVSHYE